MQDTAERLPRKRPKAPRGGELADLAERGYAKLEFNRARRIH